MSIGKSLAEKYVGKNISELEGVLNKIGSFQQNFKKISKEKDFYNICSIFSSDNLSQEKIDEIKTRYGISVDVKTEVHIDKNILGGVVVYYQGKKWDESMRDIFNRFNEM